MKLKAMLSDRRLLIVNLSLIVFLLGVVLPVMNIVSHRLVQNQAQSAQAQFARYDGTPGSSGYQAVNTKLDLSQVQNSFRDVAAKVLPTVVEVDVVDVVKQPAMQSPFDFFFGNPNGGQQQPQRSLKQYGLGSGVIVRQDGNKVYVLTNNHVAGNAQEISVKLNNGKQYKAQLVGADENKDLALIQFMTSDRVPVATLGDSSQIAPGDWVLAVGNPLGFESTVTAGIVSATGRQSQPNSGVAALTDYIQTDAAINEGNSGGALVDMNGDVIGINTWIASQNGGSIGIGFAIPINNARKAIDDFIKNGKIIYGWTGMNIGDASNGIAQDLGVANSTGALVYDVVNGSPASRGGLEPGDFITSVNGQNVKDSSELLYTVANMAPGDKADFSVIREGQNKDVVVTIGTRPDAKSINQGADLWPGMAVVPLTSDIRQQIGIDSRIGKVVIGSVSQGSKPAIAGFQSGDVIEQINGKNIGSVKDFYGAINANASQYMFKIYRGGNELLLGLSK